MKYIELTRGKQAIVDDCDYDKVSQYKWWIQPSGDFYYADGWVNGKHIKMHHFLLTTPKGMEVDHINHNGLDNRRCNLRVCTRAQNQHNRMKGRGISRFKGVNRHPDDGKWVARIGYEGARLHLGRFHSEDDAGLAYNNAAIALYGEYALLNEVMCGSACN